MRNDWKKQKQWENWHKEKRKEGENKETYGLANKNLFYTFFITHGNGIKINKNLNEFLSRKLFSVKYHKGSGMQLYVQCLILIIERACFKSPPSIDPSKITRDAVRK